MKAYGKVAIYLHSLTSALETDECLDSRSGQLIPEVRAHGTLLIGGRVSTTLFGKEKAHLPINI